MATVIDYVEPARSNRDAAAVLRLGRTLKSMRCTTIAVRALHAKLLLFGCRRALNAVTDQKCVQVCLGSLSRCIGEVRWAVLHTQIGRCWLREDGTKAWVSAVAELLALCHT